MLKISGRGGALYHSCFMRLKTVLYISSELHVRSIPYRLLRFGKVYFHLFGFGTIGGVVGVTGITIIETLFSFIVERPIIINTCGVIGQLIYISACVGQ